MHDTVVLQFLSFRIFLSTVSSLLFNPVQFNIVQRITCCNCCSWLLFKTLKMQGRISGFIHDIDIHGILARGAVGELTNYGSYARVTFEIT